MDLNKLSTAAVTDEVDFNDMPPQMGSYPDPPTPGPKRFKLPVLTAANFDEREDKEDPKKRWLVVNFDANAPLEIVQSKDTREIGDAFQTRLNNQPRRRSKDEHGPKVSDMSYLAAALGATARPANNKAWAEFLIASAGKEFTADVEYSWRCREDKAIYADDGAGGYAEVANTMGCGTKYYQKDAPKVDGQVPLRITCQCQASLKARADLSRFRA